MRPKVARSHLCTTPSDALSFLIYKDNHTYGFSWETMRSAVYGVTLGNHGEGSQEFEDHFSGTFLRPPAGSQVLVTSSCASQAHRPPWQCLRGCSREVQSQKWRIQHPSYFHGRTLGGRVREGRGTQRRNERDGERLEVDGGSLGGRGKTRENFSSGPLNGRTFQRPSLLPRKSLSTR